jgi:hypothetical protein
MTLAPSTAAQPAALTDLSANEPLLSAAGSQRLNAMDGTMLAVDAAVRSGGSPGFNTQTQLWLAGQIDIDRLQSALRALSQRYPVITARLSAGAGGEPEWKFRPAVGCPLHESHLSSDNPSDVLRRASVLLSEPLDPREHAPIQFHLIHRGNGRDVVLVQFSHVLMDHPGVLPLLLRLQTLEESLVPQPIPERDALPAYLASCPRLRRLRAAWDTAYLRLGSLQADLALFGAESKRHEGEFRLEFATRDLSVDDTHALGARVTAACGFPGLSMALLGSVFRTGQHLGLVRSQSARLTAGIGIELGLRSGDEILLQNLSSVMPVVALREQLHCRRALTQMLNAQMRERLERRIDLGVIELSRLFRRRRSFVRFMMKRLMNRGYSVWYAYFGSSDRIGARFFDVPIEDFRSFGPCWPSVGLTVIADQFRGRLQLHCTYVPQRIAPAQAEAFMDKLVDDLLSWNE